MLFVINFHELLGEWNLRQFWNITSGIYLRCEDVRWVDLRWEDLRCEDVRWEDLRCEGVRLADPFFWRTLRSDALGNMFIHFCTDVQI